MSQYNLQDQVMQVRYSNIIPLIHTIFVKNQVDILQSV